MQISVQDGHVTTWHPVVGAATPRTKISASMSFFPLVMDGKRSRPRHADAWFRKNSERSAARSSGPGVPQELDGCYPCLRLVWRPGRGDLTVVVTAVRYGAFIERIWPLELVTRGSGASRLRLAPELEAEELAFWINVSPLR